MTDSVAPSMAAEDAAMARLAAVRQPRELHAGILALILPRGSHRARRAWQVETPGIAGAPELRESTKALPAEARLPFLETLLERMAREPLAARQELIEATRRVMAARGTVRPIDRLHWLVMRKWLGEAPAEPQRGGGSADLSRWLQSEVIAIAGLSAWLSRLVPDEARGFAWYESVLNPWRGVPDLPPHHHPDAEAMVVSLEGVLSLGWMQRPVLLRHWVSLAIDHHGGSPLPEEAADTLRLMGLLLDCPLPPELARQFVARPLV